MDSIANVCCPASFSTPRFEWLDPGRISRSHYYEIKEAIKKFSAEGLAPHTWRKRVWQTKKPAGEAQILQMTERCAFSDQLKLIGIGVSPSTSARRPAAAPSQHCAFHGLL